MHLKTLTLKGFKSFASTTTLHFEPGVTCVVGPNGSGKSNVVDALAWVMGEQGAKSLRGGKMEDVIFSGTTGRAPLGRAEVALTIDNSDGALPIEFSEVTISRTLFRNGGSDYAINGEPCRLLDVQELLSDSGIGREMHVIVGQGQLDSILHATPEDRRGFIEEAAGVLKHRKRKEKALRKLDSMEGNLTRLNDITAELRRQLKPLGRQAEVARRATVIQSEVRDARLRLMADDLGALRASLAAEVADESALRERQAGVEMQISELRQRESLAEAAEREQGPELTRIQETWFSLNGLRERYLGLVQLGSEKVRNLAPETEEEHLGRDPESIDAEARNLRRHEFELGRELESLSEQLLTVGAQRGQAEDALSAEVTRIQRSEKELADRNTAIAKLRGQCESAQTRIDTRGTEIERLQQQIQEARDRGRSSQAEFQAIETQVVSLGDGEQGLDAEHEVAQQKLVNADSRVHELMTEEARLDRERAALAARVEALSMALERKDGSAALADSPHVIGTVTGLLRPEPGYEVAVSAALGELANAVVVADLNAAMDSIVFLKSEDAGRSSVLVARSDSNESEQKGQAPIGRWLIDCLQSDPLIQKTVNSLLGEFIVVSDIQELRSHSAISNRFPMVTKDGDTFVEGVVTGGSLSGPSVLEVQVAFDEARESLSSLEIAHQRNTFDMAAARAIQEAASLEVGSALSKLHESDAELAAVAERLGQLGQQSRAAQAEAERLEAALVNAQESIARDTQSLVELVEQLHAVEHAEAPSIGQDLREDLVQELERARSREVDARLAVRTAEERVRAVSERAAALEQDAEKERTARAAAIDRRERRAAALIVAQALLTGAKVALDFTEVSVHQAQRVRARAEQLKKGRDIELTFVRSEVRQLVEVLEGLRDSVHRDEVVRAEQRMRIEALESKVLEDFGIEPQVLIAEYGSDQMVPPSLTAPGDEIDPNAPEPVPYPYDREEQVKRLKVAEKQLALLGRVNPLALEEYSAMEERQRFLTEQLDDLRRTRDDLLNIVKEVDARVEQVFTEAYLEIEKEFAGVFSRLFPGGEGRLVLTDPSNMLTTGVDVEARPPGKKIKRLSLLSGGERSLTAVAFLVALFKARPSPFYVLDEVEAALDDVNLGRLIDIIEELRSTSQLIVITHQKRTMEIADALYGVSMRGDGVTQIIGQRLREVEPVGA